MSLFGAILDKIFHHAGQAAPAASAPAAQPVAVAQPAAVAAAAAPLATTSPAPAPVDVEAVLSRLSDERGADGNWRSSIVDVLKLLDLDSSLEARKQLADELGVHDGAPGSAEENIALRRAVMSKLAENGGVVPDSLKR